MTQPRPYEVDAAELARRWTELIRPRLFRRAQPATDPIALFIGAQPGAGKTPTAQRITGQYGRRFVSIDSDELRKFHPQFGEIMRTDPLQMAVLTNQAASTWVQMASPKLAPPGHLTVRRTNSWIAAYPYMLERAAHARAVATAKGRRVGRPSVVNPNQLDYASRLRDEGLTIAEIVEKTGITRTSLYRPGRPSTTPETPPADPDRANLVSRRGTRGDATYKSVRNRRRSNRSLGVCWGS